jgi:hypothetical protein
VYVVSSRFVFLEDIVRKSGLLIILVIMSFAVTAQAKVLELYFQPQTGGMWGLTSQAKLPWGDETHVLNTEEDYFKTHQGGNVGFSTGLEFLFVDVVLDVNQFYKNDRQSTFFTLMAGFDADFDLSENSVWTIYLMGGFGMGTIDNAWLEKEDPQVAHEDLYSQVALVRVGARYEYKLTKNLRLAFEGGIGAHIMQLSYKAANEDEAQSSGVHAFGTVGLRLQFNVFGDNEEEETGSDTSLPPAVVAVQKESEDSEPVKAPLSPTPTPTPTPTKKTDDKPATATSTEPTK